MDKVATRDISRYQTIDNKHHILHRSNVYIGNSKAIERKVHVYNNERAIECVKITMPEAVERVQLETLANAVDAVKEALKDGYAEKRPIVVTVSKSEITIWNGGIAIQNVKNKEGDYLATKCFGQVNTSSNYGENINTTEKEKAVNEEVVIIGTNGWGAKLANIFSKTYKLENADGTTLLTQIWKDNMTICGDPQITPLKDNYVQVTYTLDMSRFEYKEYDEMAIQLFRSHCFDFSYSSQSYIKFNGEEYTPINIYQYAKFHWPDAKTILVGYLWKDGDKYKTVKTEWGNIQMAYKVGIFPLIEYAIIDTEDKGRQISFVNGLLSREGGTHTDAIYSEIADTVLPTINTKETKKLNKTSIKQKACIIASAYIRGGNMAMSSNMKTKLTSPTFKVNLTNGQKKDLLEFNFVKVLKQQLNDNIIASLTNNKTNLRVNVNKLIDANLAPIDRKKRDNAPLTLILTEGDSAANLVNQYFQHDRDHYGILPLRGKVLNIAKCKNEEKIFKNKEYMSIIEAFGLKEGLDYSIDANMQTTRYDRILIATDQDEDGEHIKGTLVNTFRIRYPGLTERKEMCILMFETPLISLWIGKKRLVFFSHQEYSDWCLKNPQHSNLEIKYHKGLGSFSDIEIKEDKKNDINRSIPIIYDSESDKNLSKAFSGDTKITKPWILSHKDEELERIGDSVTVSDLVNHHVIRYSVESMRRGHASMDGFKPTTRKIMSAAFKCWANIANKKKRVDAFAGYIADNMCYHHGLPSLEVSIARLTLDYVGTNNMAPLLPDGSFGNRNGFKASAARYINTKLQDWTPYMFKREDLDITPKVLVDGEEAEYAYIPQVLPILLINGNFALSSGWTSYIPPAKPKSVAKYYKERLLGGNPKIFRPWFKGFKGSINVVETSKLKKEDKKELDNVLNALEDDNANNEEKDDPDVDNDVGIPTGYKNAKYSMIITCNYEIGPQNEVIIKEIPVDMKINTYIEFLNSLVQEGVISHFNNYTLDNNPHLVLYGLKEPSLKLLRLRTIKMLSNLNILGENGMIKEYTTIKEIADAFYEWNLPHYLKRKNHLIKTYEYEIGLLTNRYKYIDLVNHKKIVIANNNAESIKASLKENNIPFEDIKDIKLWHCNKDKLDKLHKTIEKLQESLINCKHKTPEQFWLEDLDSVEKYLI